MATWGSDRYSTDGAVARLSEEAAYEQVSKELEEGKIRQGLWTKALAESNGDKNRTESLYIRYRVQSLLDEARLMYEAQIAESVAQKKKSQKEKRGKLVEKTVDVGVRILIVILSLFILTLILATVSRYL